MRNHNGAIAQHAYPMCGTMRLLRDFRGEDLSDRNQARELHRGFRSMPANSKGGSISPISPAKAREKGGECAARIKNGEWWGHKLLLAFHAPHAQLSL